MNKLRIILDEENFQISQLNSVSSGFYVQIDNFSFPSEQWIDLSVSIVEMWLAVVNKHLLYAQNDSVLNFMEGDYEIRLRKETNYCSFAFFVEPNGSISHSTTIDSLYLARQLLSVSSKTMKLLQEHTNTYHMKKLKELTSALRTTVHKLSKTKDNSR